MEEDTVRLDEPEPLEVRPTIVGLRDAVSPEDGETDVARLTVPAKLLRLARLMVEVADDPAWKLTLEGLPETVKSGGITTFAGTTSECEIEPLVPVRVTV